MDRQFGTYEAIGLEEDSLWQYLKKACKQVAKDEFGNLRGKPGKLIRLIDEKRIRPIHVELVEKTIWQSSVVQWDRWNRDLYQDAQSIDFRVVDGDQLTRQEYYLPEIGQLVSFERVQPFECDIKEVKGIAASKSSGYDFDSIEQFAKQRCVSFLAGFDQESFFKNINWGEIRLGRMNFEEPSWSDYGLYWVNSGGSHHFATAHHIASAMDIDYKLCGSLLRKKINRSAVKQLMRNWDMFLMDEVSVFTDFIDAMTNFKCYFGTCDVPKNLFKKESQGDGEGLLSSKVRVVFLDRNNARASKVSKELHGAGFSTLNKYMEELR